MILNIKICKDNYRRVGGKEDSDVPDSMQIGETDARPVRAKKPKEM